MTSDVSLPPDALYQLRLVSILARAFHRYMESHQPCYRTRAGKVRLKSAAHRSRDRATVDFAYEFLVEDMLLAHHQDTIAAWMLDMGLSHSLLHWNGGVLVPTRAPGIRECRELVRARWREAQASGHPVIHNYLDPALKRRYGSGSGSKVGTTSNGSSQRSDGL